MDYRVFFKKNRISYIHRKRKINTIGMVTLLRVFLWWGTEVVRQVLTYREPRARIIHVFRSENLFPVSKWIFTKKQSYCLVSGRSQPKVDIVELEQISQN